MSRDSAAAAPPLLLQAQGLHAWYGASHVLHGVDISIAHGQTVGLLGRNGMGKSTLIRSLLGHVTERKGRIVIDGHDLSRARPHEVARRGVAYVPEGRGVFPNLTVLENLVMAARPAPAGSGQGAGWPLERVLQTFPRLAERLKHLGAQLSGGEQQMLAIGRVLMTNPHLIILDEATEGLAPLVREEIWRCLATLKQKGLAVLVIDKYVRNLVAIADRHYIIERGSVRWEGSSAQLSAQPEIWHRYLGV